MGLSGVVVAVVKLVTDVIAVGCCVLRWYILRKKKSAGTQWSHVLFTSAVLCEVAATVLSTMVLLDADAYIAKHGLAVGQLYLLNETVLKVRLDARRNKECVKTNPRICAAYRRPFGHTFYTTWRSAC